MAPLLRFGILVLMAFTASPVYAQTASKFTNLIDSSGSYSGFQTVKISPNGAYVICSARAKTGGAQALLLHNGQAQVVAQVPGQYDSFFDLGVNDSGHVVALAIQNNVYSIEYWNGSSLVSLPTPATYLAFRTVAIAANDNMAVLGDHANYRREIFYISPAGKITSVTTNLSASSDPYLNASGALVFVGLSTNQVIMESTVGPGHPLKTVFTASSVNLDSMGAPILNDKGEIAFWGTFGSTGSSEGGFVRSAGKLSTLWEYNGPKAVTIGLTADDITCFNDAGRTLFTAGGGIYDHTFTVENRILAVNDPLFSSVVTACYLTRYGMDESGRIAFGYKLQDGRSGVGLSSPPAMLAVAVLPVTKAPPLLGPGDVIKYTLTGAASGSGPVDEIILTDTLPNNTTLIPSSVHPAARRSGNTLIWTFRKAASVRAQFEVMVAPEQTIPNTVTAISTELHGDATFTDGATVFGDKTAALLLSDGTVETQLVDANPASLPDLTLPSPKAVKALEARSFTADNTRFVTRAAADGVTLLLLYTKVSGPKIASVQFDLVADPSSAGALGGLWEVTEPSLTDVTTEGGHRDDTEDGPQTLRVGVETVGKQKYAYALYRAPRNFDGDDTSGEQSRPVPIHATALDNRGQPLRATDMETLTVVRPLVILQHGTFDSPEGWTEFPLFTQGGNELKSYEGWNATFPFQVDRTSFAKIFGAAGKAMPSAKAVLQNIEVVLENWREYTGTAAAQADMATHSYGGVVTRLVAQGAVSTDPGNPLTLEATNFRSARNWGHGLIHKLICIAATHRGSHTGNHLAVLNDQGLIPGVLQAVAEASGAPIDQGAVEDQMVLSPLLRTLAQTPVPCHAIVGSGLCDFNPFYAERFTKLWAVDRPGDVYQAAGALLNGDGTHNWANFRKLSNYVFNGDYSIASDDTDQAPNYDLTVSSYSMKGRMPREAYSDFSDLQAFAPDPSTSLVGRLTHGDEISMGAGNPNTTFAVALRLAYLLRQPTTSSVWSRFPATLESPPTSTEQSFSNHTNYNPGWLYEKLPIDLAQTPSATAALKLPLARAQTSSTTLSLSVDSGVGPTVSPGQTFTVTISWPGKTVKSGIVTWTGGRPEEEPFLQLDQGDTAFDVNVSPNQKPGPFTVLAVLTATDGALQEATLNFQDEDASAYTALTATPSTVQITSVDSAPLNIYGQLASGAWHSLGKSSVLSLSSSDESVATVTADGTVQPTGLGTATVTASVPGLNPVQVAVTVDGLTVPVAAIPASALPVLHSERIVPARFVLLSTANFDVTRLDAASILVNGVVPEAVSTADVNKDHRTDVVVSIVPKLLGLSRGRQTLNFVGSTAGGTIVTGSILVKAE